MVEKKTLGLAIAATAIIATVITAVVVVYVLKIRGHGLIKVVGIEAYADQDLTMVAREVDWGSVGPGETAKATLWLKNTGNAPVNLTLSSQNWDPSGAAGHMELSWNYSGARIPPGAAIKVDLFLHVHPSITGIWTFEFDIIITAAG